MKESIKAANLEFEKEPMDENYSNLIAGYPSRLRVKKILTEMGDLTGKRVLDAGCEAGHISLKLLKRGAKVTAVDIVKPALNKFRSKLIGTGFTPIIIRAPIQKLPFKAQSFDVVLCTETLEHAPNTKKCIKELLRVLKKDGKLVLTFPNEKNRRPLYPIAKLLGINTSIEPQVTLFELHPSKIGWYIHCSGGTIIKHYSFPWYFSLTHMITATK